MGGRRREISGWQTQGLENDFMLLTHTCVPDAVDQVEQTAVYSLDLRKEAAVRRGEGVVQGHIPEWLPCWDCCLEPQDIVS